MATTGPIITWLHCFEAEGRLAHDAVAPALGRAGIAVAPLNPESPSWPGLVAFSAISPAVTEFIRRFSHDGRERLLAVTTGEALARGAAWAVLQAGAEDVLAWDESNDPAGKIAARLQRWQAVDEIVHGPLVRENLVGRSRAWISLLRQVVEVARFTDAPVLVTGETGTGKELIARLIHTLSPQRSQRDLVVLDCTTIVPDLSGSELFGHERGSYTGAVSPRDGAFALANGGTLFLDEVGELSLGLQAQLLRVVQERTYKRVGSNTWQKTDFRLVCATNRNLLREEADGQFRRDLYYRLATWTFHLPPLRDRVEDIVPLARFFMRQLNLGGEPVELDDPVREFLLSRPYPGNVRDLRNMVLRIAQRHVGPGPVTIGAIPADERPILPVGPDGWQDSAFEQSIRRALLHGAGLRDLRHAVEDAAIRIAMGEEEGSLQRAARRLGVTDRALQLRRAEQRQRVPMEDAG